MSVDYEREVKEHWNRVSASHRDSAEKAIDSLPAFPDALPAPCPMCGMPVHMPKHRPPAVFQMHNSDAFPVRRPGHMRFECRTCGYGWETKPLAAEVPPKPLLAEEGEELEFMTESAEREIRAAGPA